MTAKETIEAIDNRKGLNMTTYFLHLRDDGGCTHTTEIIADSPEEAIRATNDIAQDEADDWCSHGDWGDDGAVVEVQWHLTDEDDEDDEDDDELDYGCVTVEIEPNDEKKIAAAVSQWSPPENFCGTDPDDHHWTSDGEGGCRENPGVWSTGGTSMVFRSHCRRCGLHRTEYHTGSQRNPGEHDTVEYEMLDDETIEEMRANGHMDGDE